ncbi:MAG TPA: hypothetical protein DCR94_05005 [Firmicutes bacterium]|nr:hypothetical protein [Bacillota bacterium]
MPKVAAAIAHELHLGFVFPVPGNEFAPLFVQRQSLHEQVVRGRPVVGELRALGDPIGQRAGHHAAGRHP